MDNSWFLLWNIVAFIMNDLFMHIIISNPKPNPSRKNMLTNISTYLSKPKYNV